MRTPVKYHRWIEEAPETEYEHVSYDGNPMIALAAVVVVVGTVFALIALLAGRVL